MSGKRRKRAWEVDRIETSEEVRGVPKPKDHDRMMEDVLDEMEGEEVEELVR